MNKSSRTDLLKQSSILVPVPISPCVHEQKSLFNWHLNVDLCSFTAHNLRNCKSSPRCGSDWLMLF